MKEKKSYLALIFDFKRIPQYYNTKEEIVDKEGNKFIKQKKEFRYFQKEYKNRRWALYCFCGHRTDFDESFIYKDVYHITFKEPLICNGCNKKHNSFYDNELMMIYSRNPYLNVISKRFSVVEKKNSYALYSFATTVFVSATTNKLIFKDIACKSLYVSKKSDTIRTQRKEKIITVPLKSLVKHCSSILNLAMQNTQYEHIISQGLFERQVVNPLINFSKVIESKCDKRDVEKINLLLEQERENVYLKSFFKDQPKNDFHYYNTSFFEYDCNYDTTKMEDSSCLISSNRYIWIQYLKRRINIMLAISVYPPLATLVFTYGPDKFLELFTNSSLMCSLTILKRKKPTNPKDIIEVLFKSKINLENSKNKRILKYITTEERKRKRKLKKNPEDFSLNSPIYSHPTEWVDVRVPIFNGIKKELKFLNFRKFYADLFMEKDFDDIAIAFYGVIKNDMPFDKIETLDNIILSYDIKTAHSIIVGLSRSYESNKQRIIDFKFNYTFTCHLIKILKSYDIIHSTSLIDFYYDSIFMLNSLQIPVTEILKNKNFQSLRDMHDSLSNSYKLVLDKKKIEALTKHLSNFRHTEGIFENISFSLLDTPERFYNESSVMNHCVKTYCNNTADGHFVIYSVEDLDTGDRATLSISCINGMFTFNQLKAKNNAKSTEKIINCVKEFILNFFNIKDYPNSSDLLLTKQHLKDIPLEEIVLQQNNNIMMQEFFIENNDIDFDNLF